MNLQQAADELDWEYKAAELGIHTYRTLDNEMAGRAHLHDQHLHAPYHPGPRYDGPSHGLSL
jgi:hypothetical protein